jgi:hypothetical protein
MQDFGRGNMITECEQPRPRILEHISVPLELIAKHSVRLDSIASEMSMRMSPASAWPMITDAWPPKFIRHAAYFIAGQAGLRAPARAHGHLVDW